MRPIEIETTPRRTASKSILVVEDDITLSTLIVDHLQRVGYSVKSAGSWQEGRSLVAQEVPNLLIMDNRLPDADGIEVLPELSNQTAVIILTAYGSVQNAVQAIKAGASEYLTKPINLDELELVVARALETNALRQEHLFWKSRARDSNRHTLVGNSSRFKRLIELIELVAPSDMTVLVQGESGVGKELVARAIHQTSSRTDQNFIVVDCCTLQEALFESELFGHEKGAFTGAAQLKKGLIEGAEGGTLFLDEIGEIEPSAQAKLLRLLDTGQFRRVGSNRNLRADVRVVAATNRDLEQEVQEKRFREDLYYRLTGFVVNVPALRERSEDIPALVQHFLKFNSLSRRSDKAISPAALDQLIRYEWYGNVRELRNVIERAIVVSGDQKTIEPQHLGLHSRNGNYLETTSLLFDHEPTLEDIQVEYLNRLLSKYQGHRATIARVLGVSERNLYRLINRYGLSKPHEQAQ
ncbi:MAG: sigma-54 dependent transcriptional regulator [Arenicellales bacterium]|nr:sigma-54 dependent transcriptional regulator [Arenicellales bacterium]